jgi:uncharacterized protein (DUF952 family)
VTDTVCHIVDRATWAAVRGVYAPPSLAAEGFLHLSRPEQVAATVARLFAGVPDLVVLHVPAAALGDALRWEPVDGDIFPHLYGPLDPSLVTAVVPL